MQATPSPSRWFEILASPRATRASDARSQRDEAERIDTVFLVEPDKRIQTSMSWILTEAELKVVAYQCGEDLLASLADNPAGCAIVKAALPGLSGVAVIEELSRRSIDLPVILITGSADARMATAAFRAGAFDVIGEDLDLTLLDRVQKALETAALRRRQNIARAQLRARLHLLTPRELEIIKRVARGQANKVVAYDLGISERTVEVHRANATKKIGTRSIVDLARIIWLGLETTEGGET